MEGRFLVRVYGDSLSMPRHSEGVRYFETYPFLIETARRAQFPGERVTTYYRAFADASSERLLTTYRSDAFYFGPLAGDVGILQCGIVDCAPRPLPPKVRSVVSRLPEGLRRSIVSGVHRNRAKMLRAGLLWRVTPPDIFLNSMKALVKEMSETFLRVYVINIAPTTEATEARSPGLSESIGKYNELVRIAVSAAAEPNTKLIDVYRLVSSSPDPMEQFVSSTDGHHILAKAHRVYADAILDHERALWSRDTDPARAITQ